MQVRCAVGSITWVAMFAAEGVQHDGWCQCTDAESLNGEMPVSPSTATPTEWRGTRAMGATMNVITCM
eukprot:1970680-Alexandrium_andersonii.AAC.1